VAEKNVSGMGVGIFQILIDKPTGDPAVVAKRAEELGFVSYWVPEHAVIPEGSCEAYPASTPGEPPPDYLYKMPDPLIALSRASAVTSSIKLGTGIALVPERNPLVAAKEIASLDHYSGGRVLYGIGAGWNEAECTVMGGDFPRRWTQTKEAIEAMRLLWTGEYVEHHGKYYDFPKVVCRPKPVRPSGPPVLLASIANARVYKRVGQWGDGWLPICTDPQELADGKAEIARYARDAGRDPDGLDMSLFAPTGMFRTRADLAEVAKAGASNTILWLTGNDEKEILAELEDLAGALF
jgi:probable F420-dependent oxidoreductase